MSLLIMQQRGNKDKFGRIWYIPLKELCPKCKQPDSCGNCNHKKLTKKEVKELREIL